MRALANCRGCSIASGKQMASRFDLKTPQNGVRLDFGSLRQFLVAQRLQAFGFLRRGYPHHAAAVAGQRHKYARPLAVYEIPSRYSDAVVNG